MKTNPSLEFLKPAALATLAIVITCGLSAPPAQAGYIVTLQQVGPNVVATGSGPIDLSGLNFFLTTGGSSPQIIPGQGGLLSMAILTGPFNSNVDIYTGFSGPTSFGSGATTASFGTGNLVGVDRFNGTLELFVPVGYISGAPLLDSATYNNATFASLGVTPGTYVWSWGTGANQNFTLQAVPDSGSTFGLLLLAVAPLFGISCFRSLRLG